MEIRSEMGLTFDDVLLVPKRSNVRSRKSVDCSTWLTAGIRLANPIVSANMDTVTEDKMAIAMAQAGGIGIIHRFMTTERQVEMVRRVKRAEGFIVEDPITIGLLASVGEARRKMAETRIGGLVVLANDRRLAGMLTARDVLFAPDDSAPVESVMTRRENLIVANQDETLSSARLRLHAHRIEKLPLVDEQDHVVGLITAQDIIKIQEHPQATKDEKGRLRVGAAIGVRPEDLDRARALAGADVDVLVVDVAHGHSESVISMVRLLKKEISSTPIIAGNVATGEGVMDLVNAGADAVKVGVGSG